MASETAVEVVVNTEAEPESVPQEPSPSPEGKKKGNNFLRRRKNGNNEKSRKPPGNKWLQQQIPACRPVFTASHVFVVFIIIGLIFLALGIAFTVVSLRLREFEIPYTNCNSTENSTQTCEDYLDELHLLPNIKRAMLRDCHCQVNFELTETLRSPWYIYYSMDNYYQNHRRYVNSWDTGQLRGGSFRSPSSDCRPIIDQVPAGENDSLPVVLCGLIANSFFNDSFDAFGSLDSSTNVTINRTNIAWNTDRTVRFQNPGGGDTLDPSELEGTTMPPSWTTPLSNITGGLQNESLMVWFRVSAFPWFRKLYGRPEVNGNEEGELPAGNYTITLTYNYPVRPFSGRKSIILAEVSWLGGRNLFIGIAYIVTGALLIIVAIGLLLVGVVFSRWKTTDRNFLKRSY